MPTNLPPEGPPEQDDIGLGWFVIGIVALMLTFVAYLIYVSYPARTSSSQFYSLPPPASELPDYSPHLDPATGKLICNEPQ